MCFKKKTHGRILHYNVVPNLCAHSGWAHMIDRYRDVCLCVCGCARAVHLTRLYLLYFSLGGSCVVFLSRRAAQPSCAGERVIITLRSQPADDAAQIFFEAKTITSDSVIICVTDLVDFEMRACLLAC